MIHVGLGCLSRHLVTGSTFDVKMSDVIINFISMAIGKGEKVEPMFINDSRAGKGWFTFVGSQGR